MIHFVFLGAFQRPIFRGFSLFSFREGVTSGEAPEPPSPPPEAWLIWLVGHWMGVSKNNGTPKSPNHPF